MPAPLPTVFCAARGTPLTRSPFHPCKPYFRDRRGGGSEHLIDLIVAAGLLGLLAYGFLHWRAGGEPFPADMRGSTVEIARRGFLLAGHTDPAPPPGDAGVVAVEALAREIGVEVRWQRAPAAELLRRLEADSLDVLARYDTSLPGAEAFGLTRPYAESGDSRLVLAVPSGENRLLRLADRAALGVRRDGSR